MPRQKDMAPNLGSFLGSPLQLGELQIVGPLTIAPIFGGRVVERFLSLEEALRQGAEAGELPQPAVQRIVVRNPTAHALLLLDGEEVVGAQQNRIIDGTQLVPPGASCEVHVCCVERQRWDRARSREEFRTSPQVMAPSLRSVKSRTSRLTGRGDQSAIWEQVGTTITDLGTFTQTLAVTDVFAQHAGRIGEVVSHLRCEADQTGVIVAVEDRIWAVDFVGDPDTFSTMFPRLMRGYAMDAVRADRRAAVSRAELQLTLERLLARPLVEPAAGTRERTLRFDGPGLPVEGAATVVGDVLVAVSAILPGGPQGDVAVERRTLRTSETDPIAVSWLPSPRGGLGITLAPGKRARSEDGRAWQRDLQLDLARLRAQHGASVVVCLLTDEELHRQGLTDYAERVAAAGMHLYRLPVGAGRAPGLDTVRALASHVVPHLDRQERVVVHCGGGLGRSGAVAGCLLVRMGLSADEWLEALKARHESKCPETSAQRALVRTFAREMAAVG